MFVLVWHIQGSISLSVYVLRKYTELLCNKYWSNQIILHMPLHLSYRDMNNVVSIKIKIRKYTRAFVVISGTGGFRGYDNIRCRGRQWRLRGHHNNSWVSVLAIQVSVWSPVPRMKVFNTLRPRRNEQYFAGDIFKRIFFNENVWISTKISLKFVQLTIFQHWFK